MNLTNVTDQTDALPERDIYLKHAPLYIYSMYLIIVWLTIGLIGNTLSFFVWISPRVRKENSSAVYLAALSVADLSLLICTMIVHIHYLFNISPVYFSPGFCEFYTIPYVAAQYMSPLLVLAFTIERWIAICFPFRRDTLCTTRRACLVVACLAFFTLAICSVHGTFFVYVKGACTVRHPNSIVMKTYSFVSEVLMGGGVPICTLICNILVILELRRIDKRNKSMSVSLMDRSGSPSRPGGNSGMSGDSGGTNFKATTVMLLSVSFFLIFTTLPAGLVYALQFVIPPGPTNLTGEALNVEMSTNPIWIRFFSLVSAKGVIDQITLSHYACNIFIYLFTGKVFRRHLQRQLLRFRFWRYICRVCCCVNTMQTDSAIVYSAVRHSLYADQPVRTMGNGTSRNSTAFPPPRNYRRHSARSSGSTGASLDAPTNNGIDDVGAKGNGGTLGV